MLDSLKTRHKQHKPFTPWWFQPILNICSSNWLISPRWVLRTTCLKPPPSLNLNKYTWTKIRKPTNANETNKTHIQSRRIGRIQLEKSEESNHVIPFDSAISEGLRYTQFLLPHVLAPSFVKLDQWNMTETRVFKNWGDLPVLRIWNHKKNIDQPEGYPGNSAGDLFGMIKRPIQGLSDLQLGDKKTWIETVKNNKHLPEELSGKARLGCKTSLLVSQWFHSSRKFWLYLPTKGNKTQNKMKVKKPPLPPPVESDRHHCESFWAHDTCMIHASTHGMRPFLPLEISRVTFGDPKPSGFCCLVDVPLFLRPHNKRNLLGTIFCQFDPWKQAQEISKHVINDLLPKKKVSFRC